MKNLFLFLFLLVVFTSKAQDNRVSGLNSRQFTKYWKVESESPDYKVTFQGDTAQNQRLQALFTNRMLREGTRRYSAAAIAEKLDYYGAWLELSSSSEYAYITLYSLNKYLPETLDIFESIVKEPLFPEKELGVIIDSNIQQFLVNSSKVDFLAHRTLINAVYGDTHPCGQLVQKEDYHLINPSVLQSFYDRYYHSGNCSIYLAGKVSEDAIRRIETLFGSEPFGKDFRKPEKRSYVPVTSSEKRIFTERADAMQSAVRMGMLSLDRRHPDYLKVRVLVTLFGGYFGSRLMSNIREDKGYTYGISAGIMPYPDSGLLVVNAETANEFVEPLIKEVYHEIDRLQNDLVPAEELAMVRNYMLGDMCDGVVSAIPEIIANDVDARLIHEAAIGKIAGEQLIKLMTLGLTEQQAEEQIIGGFLK